MANASRPKELNFVGTNDVDDIPTLENLNTAEVITLIPTIVFLLVVCVVGSAGNAFVIHLYRSEVNTSSRKCFILSLSAIDFFTCCLGIPLEVSTVMQQYTLEYIWLCKITRMLNTLGVNSSAFILCFICMDRFRKVCHPFGWQIRTGVAKFLCGLALFFGALLSLPASFIYGKHTFHIPKHNLTGVECSTADEMVDTTFPFMYSLLFGILVVTSIAVLSILYGLIGLKVWSHTRKINKLFREEENSYVKQKVNEHIGKVENEIKQDSTDVPTDDGVVENVTTLKEVNDHDKRRKDNEVIEISAELVEVKPEVTEAQRKEISQERNILIGFMYSTKSRIHNSVKKIKSKASVYSKRSSVNSSNGQAMKAARARKTTFIMFIVTLGFILSAIPHLMFMLLRQIDGDFLDELSDTGNAIYKFSLRSYFLNSAINPIIYSIYDSRFKNTCKDIVKCCCCTGK